MCIVPSVLGRDKTNYKTKLDLLSFYDRFIEACFDKCGPSIIGYQDGNNVSFLKI